MQKEQYVVIDQASRCPDFLGEEIAGPKRGQVALDEPIPRPFPAFRARIDARLTQNVGHGRSADARDAKLLQLAVNARVAPIGFSPQPQDQVTDFLVSLWPTDRRSTSDCRLVGVLSLHPTLKCAR